MTAAVQVRRPSREVQGLGETVLEARNIAKSFGAVHALKGVNFEVRRGQVTTLFGENGAGKSTLMKILSGVIQPSSGEILLDGRPRELRLLIGRAVAGHLDHPPGAEPRAQHVGARQHLHGP
ncbi:ribose ABC transporter, ATP-binding protein [Rubellimicrobium mesophilum DSM 19309]|uniref:Ribose ABC transporter, ATP-binding protein n=1 Tax=Rubellimicrobium mesophilum DSM 19309 TaxID=442562 RepID=A0A017HUU8_9RHOB|nr:ATP-binding cassette domain-containing protein [Rubellimicrobium mesophilum]EYD77519.1 ribose ABC transporter, ATP-binding protein [Rubellimicrobium mesophilum DSM 19309]